MGGVIGGMSKGGRVRVGVEWSALQLTHHMSCAGVHGP